MPHTKVDRICWLVAQGVFGWQIGSFVPGTITSLFNTHSSAFELNYRIHTHSHKQQSVFDVSEMPHLSAVERPR